MTVDFRKQGIWEKLQEVISEKLLVSMDEVTPNARFVDDLGADSLDLVELIMSMEEEFDIEISDDDAERLLTVRDAIEYANKMLSDYN